MEIIQEIIGSRKKQQLVINNEAKRTLHKQIKKVIQREVSEPPPQSSQSQFYGKQDSKGKFLSGLPTKRQDSPIMKIINIITTFFELEDKNTPQDGSEPQTFGHEASKG